MLAGYAIIPVAGWGIVAQRPKATTLAPLNKLMRAVLYKTLPIALVMLVVIWWSARRIASPLRQLANGAHDMDKPETAQNIQAVKSWYFESHELKKAMLKGLNLLQRNITKLREDVNTDPLTGLGNRRHLKLRSRPSRHRSCPSPSLPSTSTTSNASTTALAMTRATKCSRNWPTPCAKSRAWAM